MNGSKKRSFTFLILENLHFGPGTWNSLVKPKGLRTKSYHNHTVRVTREITLQNWWVAKRKALTKRMTGPRVWRWWGDSRSVERTGKQVSGNGNTCRENIQNEGETGRTAGKLGVFFSLVIRKKRAVIARLRLNRLRSELQEPHPSKKGP